MANNADAKKSVNSVSVLGQLVASKERLRETGAPAEDKALPTFNGQAAQ